MLLLDMSSVLVNQQDLLSMATHSSTLAWRIPRTEEPGGLQSTGQQSQTRLKRLSTQALGKVLLNKNTHKTMLCVIH